MGQEAKQSLTLSETLARIGWSHEPSKFPGKRDWFDAYGELIGSFDAHEGWAEVRKYLDSRADADCDDGVWVANREMRLLTELNELAA